VHGRDPNEIIGLEIGCPATRLGRANVMFTSPETPAERDDGESARTLPVAVAANEKPGFIHAIPLTITGRLAPATDESVKHVISVVVADTTEQEEVPIVTVLCSGATINPVPVIERRVPPAVEPIVGRTPVIAL